MNALAFPTVVYALVSLVQCIPFKGSHELTLRPGRNLIGKELDCIQMSNDEGDFWYRSTGDEEGTCGFYIVGHHDELVEVEFTAIDVDCKQNGAVSVIDGWELNGEYFPGVQDHALPLVQRVHQFCGKEAKLASYKTFRSSQNVALILYQIPRKGQGFQVTVRFVRNHQPCNVLSMFDTGVYTLYNYGRRINCTFSIIYPEAVQILSLNVGNAGRTFGETGLITKCAERGSEDYVEFRDGVGLSPMKMNAVMNVCGLHPMPEADKIPLPCQNSVVRLVSSGEYQNSVTFSYRKLKPFEGQCL
ncbi:corticotropin-releasing factor-binding protein [Lingula anatina]|uniref:Corticotropin-releasing factor-binding protein n=1 Tax=Lingula anatina TaxID=7574 RepID=A0A1S3HHR6_LINAN|nr:corticotropin-releasing factor-binding protein [Lingula anatina]|eukprot:XP_013385648.1 corticotropin-releasing factor-binding protein [Lingula anatina]